MAEEQSSKLVCPKCKSEDVASIIWGMPAYSEQLMKDLDEKRVVIGGCCITGDDPRWHCNDCEHEWGNCDILAQ